MIVRTRPSISCLNRTNCGLCQAVGRGETESWEWLLSPELVLEEQILRLPSPQHHGSWSDWQYGLRMGWFASERLFLAEFSWSCPLRAEAEKISHAGLSTCRAPSMLSVQSELQDRCGSWGWTETRSTHHLLPSPPGSPHSCRCVTEEQQGSWPWVITLIRGALMGTGFLLTYVLIWLYYTR